MAEHAMLSLVFLQQCVTFHCCFSQMWQTIRASKILVRQTRQEPSELHRSGSAGFVKTQKSALQIKLGIESRQSLRISLRADPYEQPQVADVVNPARVSKKRVQSGADINGTRNASRLKALKA